MKALFRWLEAIVWLTVLYGIVWLFLLQQGVKSVGEPAAATVDAIPDLIEGRP